MLKLEQRSRLHPASAKKQIYIQFFSIRGKNKMNSLLYFAYGSNMSTPRLKSRIPSAEPIAVAQLKKHRLKFHKMSNDNSGKCDIEKTNDPSDVVYGIVFQYPFLRNQP